MGGGRKPTESAPPGALSQRDPATDLRQYQRDVSSLKSRPTLLGDDSPAAAGHRRLFSDDESPADASQRLNSARSSLGEAQNHRKQLRDKTDVSE